MDAVRHRLVFLHLFGVSLLTAASQTFVSPLFPLIRADLGLAVADQATLTTMLTLAIGVSSIAGGWVGLRCGDRLPVRLAAGMLAGGSLATSVASGLGPLLAGQAMIGVGAGLFFGPGLASVGRLYAARRGRAIAAYGLSYSIGLAAAAFSGNVGRAHWRDVFLVAAVLAAALAAATPRLLEPDASPGRIRSRDAVGYLRHPGYRAALATGVAGYTVHYVVIGLVPEYFVGRGARLAFVTGLVGAARLASMGGKFVAGWSVDRIGSSRTAGILLRIVVCFGLLVVLLPTGVGVWAVAPLVCANAMLFPVANVMVIHSLPERASLGAGLYHAGLMAASAACAGAVAVALSVAGTPGVMLGTLTVPLIVALIVERWWPSGGGSSHRPHETAADAVRSGPSGSGPGPWSGC